MTESIMGDSMNAGISMDMNMPMAMEVDRRTVGGRIMGTWEWADVELKSGADNSSFGYSANTSVNEPGRTFWGKINVAF